MSVLCSFRGLVAGLSISSGVRGVKAGVTCSLLPSATSIVLISSILTIKFHIFSALS